MKAPQLLSGFRDLLPAEMIARNRAMAAVAGVFERHGFEPVETPSLEHYSTLTGKEGGESEMLMYHFQDHGDRHIGLIYDLTVPIARLVAAHPELPKPFKRYQVQRVWRAESPQKGRYREFCQCDFDIIGPASMMADAEVIAVLAAAAAAVGFDQYIVVVNHRQLLQGLLEASGVPPDKHREAIIAIDKLDKVGPQGVAEELGKRGITSSDRIIEAISLKGNSKDTIINLKAIIGGTASGRRGLAELEELLGFTESLGPRVQFRPSLARGQGYYTGPVYEVKIESPPSTGLGAGNIGSIAGGGRYDNLIGLFSGAQVPATGASFGIDRLMVALAELGLLPESTSVVQVMACHFGPGAAMEAWHAAERIRGTGIGCDLYAGEASLGKQLKYADKKGIPYAMIIGEDEVKSGVYLIKDLKKNAQESVPKANIESFFTTALARETH